MAEPTFFWHDYETFGRVPRRDRPAQFAGVRTDAALSEIGPPVMWHCQPAPDTLPDPEGVSLFSAFSRQMHLAHVRQTDGRKDERSSPGLG